MSGIKMKVIWLLLLSLSFPLAASQIQELSNTGKPISIEGVMVTPENDLWSIYSDKKLHTVQNRQYFLLVKGFPSRPNHPSGQCGAGQEMYADIYQVVDKKSVKVQRVLVVSCWRSIEQFSRGETGDFSSITWNEKGVVFDWIVPPNFTHLKGQLNLDADVPELVFTD